MGSTDPRNVDLLLGGLMSRRRLSSSCLSSCRRGESTACLWSAATNGPFVYPQMIHEYWKARMNDIERESRRTWIKIIPSATLSTTNPNWTDPGLKPGFRHDRPATNHLWHGHTLRRVNLKSQFLIYLCLCCLQSNDWMQTSSGAH
jgi:hypothetical protein